MVRPLFLHKTSIIWPCSYLKNSVKLINVLRDAPVVHLTQSQAFKTANCGGGFACLDRFFGINPVTNLESGTKNAYNKKSCHNLKLSLFDLQGKERVTGVKPRKQ